MLKIMEIIAKETKGKKLEDVLDAEQQKIYESYQNARADVEIMIQIGVFRQGFKLGVSLAEELAKMDDDR